MLAQQRRRKGLANYRLVRYADDWVVMVAGTQADAEHLREEASAVLAPMGLRLSEEKTRVVHIDEGFDFLGFRIQRQAKTRHAEVDRVHLPVEEVPWEHRRQGADGHQAGDEQLAH